MRSPVAVLVRLHLRRLWAQRLRTLLAIGAVAAGTALAVGVAIVLGSTNASLDAFGQSVAGPAPLRVVGATDVGGIPARVAAAVARAPGVSLAVPVVEVSSVVHSASGKDVPVLVIGAGCGAAGLVHIGGCTGAAGGPPTVTVGASLAGILGPASWLQTDLGTLPLADARRAAALDRVAGGRVVVTSLAAAQRLYHRGSRVDVVYVALRHGVDVAAEQARLAALVGPALGVLRADQPPPAVALATSSFVPLLVLVAAIAAGIAAVLVYDVVALSLEERRRQQAVLAAIGAPPWLVAAGPAVEASIIGASGGLLAVAGGAALAGPVLVPLSAFTQAFFGATVTVHVTAGDVLLGVVFGVVVGLLAAARPVWRMTRLDVAAELADRDRRAQATSSAAWRRTGAGIVLVAAGAVAAYAGSRHGALASWQLPVAVAGFVLTVAAGALAVGAGATVPFAVIASRRAQRHGSTGSRWVPAAARIGVAAASREPGRVAVMAVAVAAAVSVGTITAGYTQGLADQVHSGLGTGSQARAVVVDTAAGETGQNAGAHVPSAVVTAISGLPGVGTVDPYVTVLSGSRAGHLVLVGTATSPRGGPHLVEGRKSRGAFLRGAVMVGTGLARGRHLRPGSRVRLDTPGGVVALPVEGIWNDGAVNGDNVTMTPGELDRLFGNQLPVTVTVLPRPGTSPGQLLGELRSLPLPPDVTLTPPAEYRHQQVAQLTGQLAPFWTLERGMLVVAFVGVLATLLLVGVGRRREVALLGAVGMTPAGAFELVVSEAVAVAAAGAAGGVVLGAAVLGVLLMVVPLVVGFEVPYRFPISVLVTVAPLSVVLSAAAAVLPAWQAAQADVVDGLRQE